MRRLSEALGMNRRKSMVAADVEPSDFDADPMISQQKKTFRRWVNSHLNQRKLVVHDVIKDWADGILLVALMEILADTNLGKINTQPKMKLHNLENLNKVLAFIQKHVKLVNIGSEDLFNGNQTIVLGLIWTLILRWGTKLGDGGKNALLAWVNKKIQEDPLVVNFTKDWQNGMNFAKLVHAIDPEALDLESLDPDNPRRNMEIAFQAAEAALDVPSLLDPEDIMKQPDDKSVMTYVGQFFNLFGDNQVRRVKPAKPSVANATAMTADITFEFPSEGATSLRIQILKGNVADGPLFKEFIFATDSPTTFTVDGLDASSDYAAVAIAIEERNGKPSSPSAAAEFSTSKPGAPSAPRCFDATLDSVSLDWDGVPGAASYKLQVSSPAKAKEFTRIIDVPRGVTKVVVDDLAAGTPHAFRVVAVTLNGVETDPSAPTEAITKMIPAGNVKIKDVTDCDAVVAIHAFSKPYPPGTNFKVQIAESSNTDWNNLNQEHIVPVGGNPTLLDVNELDADKEYLARVVAVSPDGAESEPSPEVAFATIAEVAKSKVCLITGGNTPTGVTIAKDVLNGKFGQFDVVFICVRENGGDTASAIELRELAENSKETACKITLLHFDKNNAQSVRDAAKACTAGKIHLVVNNAKLRREQLSLLVGN